ncbi:MAG: hypothetical protein ACK4OM_07130 [Alphaproteobacteria bacterium]
MIKYLNILSKFNKKLIYTTKYNYIKFNTLYNVSNNPINFYHNYLEYDELFILYKKLILEKNIDNLSLISLKDADGWEDRKGNAYKRSIVNQNSVLMKCSNDDIINAEIIAFGGIEFDDLPAHSALLKNIETLLGASHDPLKTITFQPFVSRSERYKHLLNYSLNPNYTPEYILKFVENHILPIINDKINFKNPDHILTLFSFSAGGREIMMIENALYKIFKTNEYNLNEEEIERIFSKINVVSIGYACKFTYNTNPKFRKIIIYAIEDSGVLLPQFLTVNYLDKYINIISSEPYTIFSNDLGNQKENEFLIVLGKNTIPKYLNGKKPNEKGHALPNYIYAIQDFIPSSVHKDILISKSQVLSKFKNNFWQNKINEKNSSELIKY